VCSLSCCSFFLVVVCVLPPHAFPPFLFLFSALHPIVPASVLVSFCLVVVCDCVCLFVFWHRLLNENNTQSQSTTTNQSQQQQHKQHQHPRPQLFRATFPQKPITCLAHQFNQTTTTTTQPINPTRAVVVCVCVCVCLVLFFLKTINETSQQPMSLSISLFHRFFQVHHNKKIKERPQTHTHRALCLQRVSFLLTTRNTQTATLCV